MVPPVVPNEPHPSVHTARRCKSLDNRPIEKLPKLVENVPAPSDLRCP
jgi:hypothetical protein